MIRNYRISKFILVILIIISISNQTSPNPAKRRKLQPSSAVGTPESSQAARTNPPRPKPRQPANIRQTPSPAPRRRKEPHSSSEKQHSGTDPVPMDQTEGGILSQSSGTIATSNGQQSQASDTREPGKSPDNTYSLNLRVITNHLGDSQIERNHFLTLFELDKPSKLPFIVVFVFTGYGTNFARSNTENLGLTEAGVPLLEDYKRIHNAYNGSSTTVVFMRNNTAGPLKEESRMQSMVHGQSDEQEHMYAVTTADRLISMHMMETTITVTVEGFSYKTSFVSFSTKIGDHAPNVAVDVIFQSIWQTFYELKTRPHSQFILGYFGGLEVSSNSDTSGDQPRQTTGTQSSEVTLGLAKELGESLDELGGGNWKEFFRTRDPLYRAFKDRRVGNNVQELVTNFAPTHAAKLGSGNYLLARPNRFYASDFNGGWKTKFSQFSSADTQKYSKRLETPLVSDVTIDMTPLVKASKRTFIVEKIGLNLDASLKTHLAKKTKLGSLYMGRLRISMDEQTHIGGTTSQPDEIPEMTFEFKFNKQKANVELALIGSNLDLGETIGAQTGSVSLFSTTAKRKHSSDDGEKEEQPICSGTFVLLPSESMSTLASETMIYENLLGREGNVCGTFILTMTLGA